MTPYDVIGWERANGDANKIKTELFNDIHQDSGSHLGQTMSRVSIQLQLASQVQWPYRRHTMTPPNKQYLAANDIHDLHNETHHGLCRRYSQIRLDRDLALGSASACLYSS